MRAVEKLIINYLRNNDFVDYPRLDSIKNLSMRDSVDISSEKKRVYLWGSCIFMIDKENNIKFSFRGWQTSTTKGRINALLSAFSSCSAYVFQKKITSWFFLLPPVNFLLIQAKSTPSKTESPRK